MKPGDLIIRTWPFFGPTDEPYFEYCLVLSERDPVHDTCLAFVLNENKIFHIMLAQGGASKMSWKIYEAD